MNFIPERMKPGNKTLKAILNEEAMVIRCSVYCMASPLQSHTVVL
jgi:hypothetical protein